MDPLRISLVGLSNWESEFVKTTLNIASGIEIAPCDLVEDPDRADVLLVDADRSGQRLLRHGADRRGDAKSPVVIAFSADPTNESSIPWRHLKRPVNHAELISILRDIERERSAPQPPPPLAEKKESGPRLPSVESAPQRPQPLAEKKESGPRLPSVESAPQPPPLAEKKESGPRLPSIESAPQPPPVNKELPTVQPARAAESPKQAVDLQQKTRPARRFVEATRLLGLLRRVLRNGQPVEITHPDFPTLSIYPQLHAYESGEDVAAVPRMFRASAMEFSIRPIPGALDGYSTSRYRPLSRLVYCAALFGSEGRLVLNCSTEDKLRLVDWPDFDSLPHVAEHRKIARFMLQNDAKLTEIASSTSAGIELVIDFCNACEAAGLVRRTPALIAPAGVRDDTAKGAITPLLHRVRGLFKP